jgi:CO/xanthine dehydrogenase Mo-binding subunit
MDPFEIRRINAVTAGFPTGADHLLEEGVDGIKETIEAAQAKYRQLQIPAGENGKRIGVGVASAMKNVGFGHGIRESASAVVHLDSRGEVELCVTHHEYGQGGWAGEIRIASNELDLPFKQITIVKPDTAVTPPTGPTTASRQTFLTGNAVVLACRELKAQVFGRAAETLDVEPGNLFFEGSQVVDRKTGRGVELKELGDDFSVQKTYTSPLTDQMLEDESSHYGDADFKSMVTHVMYSYTTQVAIVEVDQKSGDVEVLTIISANDVGKALNPLIIKGQIEGGVMMGLGYALTERFLVEEGVNLTDSLHKVRIPTASHTPEIIPVIVEVPHPFSPQGMKGFAEAPSLATAPAILNAIYDAVGVRIRDLPANKKRVREALGLDN